MKKVLRAPIFDKGKGTDSMINLSSSWSEMAVSQQEKVLHSGALEIEEVKQVSGMHAVGEARAIGAGRKSVMCATQLSTDT